jgi:hypothetical protein
MSMTVRMTLMLAPVCAACATHDVVVGELDEIVALSAVPNHDLDLLFVIDNSESMADKQLALAQAFPRMADKLTQLDGGLPNLHIGVITSDMGTQGSAVATPGPDVPPVGAGGCSGVGQDGALQVHGVDLGGQLFISDVEDASAPGGRARNYAGDLRDVVGNLLQVGSTGCGFEQHLAALRRSFATPANAGFFRPDANLGIVILADEDDCSLLDPRLLSSDSTELGPRQSFRCFDQGVICVPGASRTPGAKHDCMPRADGTLVESIGPFVAAVEAVKPDPRRVMVTAVVGDPAPVEVVLAPPSAGELPIPALVPSCTFDGPGGPERADPAVRLAAFVDRFAGRLPGSSLGSICSADLAGPVDAIARTARRMVGDPCIDTTGLADASSDPGIQPACEVSDVRDSDSAHPIALSRCTGDAATDCYAIAPDAARCPAGDDHLRLQLRRSTPAAVDTWTHVRCQRAPAS